MNARSTAKLLLSLALFGQYDARGQDIVVGQILSLTGPASEVARDIQYGTQACIDWLNVKGGVGGRKLKIEVRDDGGDPAEAIKLAQELIEKANVSVLLGPSNPSVNRLLLPWVSHAGLPVLGFPVGPGAKPGEDETAFYLTPGPSAELEKLVGHLRVLGVQRIALIYNSETIESVVVEAFRKMLTSANMSLAGLATIDTEGANAEAAVKAAMASQPQAVILGTTGRPTVAALKVLRDGRSATGLYGVYGLSFAATPRELKSLGPGKRGLIMTQVFPPVGDRRHRISRTYQEAMDAVGDQPGFSERSTNGMEGCAGPLVLADVLKKPVNATRAGILKALRDAGSASIGDMQISLDKRRPLARFVDLVTIGADGKTLR